ncbi:MAG: hypothetical protein CVT72_16840, partial [Alphaproteobacteria bacterium HGW-Alphaproteobacteria-11]
PRAALWQMVIMAVGGIVVLFALRWAVETGGAAAGLSPVAILYLGAAILGFYMTGLAPIGFRALRLMK